jgi:hypothetical protein
MRRTAVLLVLAIWSREARAQLSVSGSPAQLTVATATAGFPLDAVTGSSTNYTVNPPGPGNHAITAHLDADMPAGVTLTVTLTAAGGASSDGAITLSTTPQNVVTGITKKINNGSITYQLSATTAAGVVPLQTRQVTFTYISIP